MSNKEQKKVRCLNISNLVHNKVVEFFKYQPHEGLNQLLSVKSTRTDKQKSVCHIKLFWLT